ASPDSVQSRQNPRTWSKRCAREGPREGRGAVLAVVDTRDGSEVRAGTRSCVQPVPQGRTARVQKFRRSNPSHPNLGPPPAAWARVDASEPPCLPPSSGGKKDRRSGLFLSPPDEGGVRGSQG